MVIRNQDSHATLTITVASATTLAQKGDACRSRVTDNECGAKEFFEHVPNPPRSLTSENGRSAA
jgi:hypothetical protein